jgi:hypothetical protein
MENKKNQKFLVRQIKYLTILLNLVILIGVMILVSLGDFKLDFNESKWLIFNYLFYMVFIISLFVVERRYRILNKDTKILARLILSVFLLFVIILLFGIIV